MTQTYSLPIKAFLGAMAFAALAIFAQGAHAADATVTGSNTGTGDLSNNTNTTNVDQSSNVSVYNDADLNNSVHVWANTGNNTAGSVGGDASITTGDINGSVNVSNDANSTSVTQSAGGSASVTSGNSDTGTSSNNTNDVNVDQDNNVRIHNDADVNNDVSICANTGYNNIGDTKEGDCEPAVILGLSVLDTPVQLIGGDASITTGDITTGVSLSNDVNSSDVSGGGGGGGSVTLENSDTGTLSNNTNTVNVDQDGNVKIHNDADITNCVNVDANTGYNEASSLGGDSTITTGDINLTVDIDNVANTVLVSLLGQNGFTVLLTNSNTGTSSNNTNTVDVDQDSNVRIHNDADVHNWLNILLNTGYNTCSTLGGSCTITTGNINFLVTIRNDVNSTTVGNPLGRGSGDQQLPAAPLGLGAGSATLAATGLGAGLAPTGANSLLLSLLLALLLALVIYAATQRRGGATVRLE